MLTKKETSKDTSSLGTTDRLRRWLSAAQSVVQAKSELRSAETEEYNARCDLGKFLCPADAKDGEEFSVWINFPGEGDRMLCVKKDGNSFVLRWRK